MIAVVAAAAIVIIVGKLYFKLPSAYDKKCLEW